jgi:hypothetical protein
MKESVEEMYNLLRIDDLGNRCRRLPSTNGGNGGQFKRRQIQHLRFKISEL